MPRGQQQRRQPATETGHALPPPPPAAAAYGRGSAGKPRQQVLVLNPAPAGGDAAPAPVARTLPAATLEALYSCLPHYASKADFTRK